MKLTVEFGEDPLDESGLPQHDLVQSVPVALRVLDWSLVDGWAVSLDSGVAGGASFSESEIEFFWDLFYVR